MPVSVTSTGTSVWSTVTSPARGFPSTCGATMPASDFADPLKITDFTAGAGSVTLVPVPMTVVLNVISTGLRSGRGPAIFARGVWARSIGGSGGEADRRRGADARHLDRRHRLQLAALTHPDDRAIRAGQRELDRDVNRIGGRGFQRLDGPRALRRFECRAATAERRHVDDDVRDRRRSVVRDRQRHRNVGCLDVGELHLRRRGLHEDEVARHRRLHADEQRSDGEQPKAISAGRTNAAILPKGVATSTTADSGTYTRAASSAGNPGGTPRPARTSLTRGFPSQSG